MSCVRTSFISRIMCNQVRVYLVTLMLPLHSIHLVLISKKYFRPKLVLFMTVAANPLGYPLLYQNYQSIAFLRTRNRCKMGCQNALTENIKETPNYQVLHCRCCLVSKLHFFLSPIPTKVFLRFFFCLFQYFIFSILITHIFHKNSVKLKALCFILFKVSLAHILSH